MYESKNAKKQDQRKNTRKTLKGKKFRIFRRAKMLESKNRAKRPEDT